MAKKTYKLSELKEMTPAAIMYLDPELTFDEYMELTHYFRRKDEEAEKRAEDKVRELFDTPEGAKKQLRDWSQLFFFQMMGEGQRLYEKEEARAHG